MKKNNGRNVKNRKTKKYQTLFKQIAKTLAINAHRVTTSIENVRKTLKSLQRKPEKISYSTKKHNENNDLYSAMQERLNLQSLGYFLKDESTLNFIHSNSFTERDHNAEKELRDTLNAMLNAETAQKIYPEIVSYTSIKEEIQFSLGMKTGAKLAILLTDDSEYDY